MVVRRPDSRAARALAVLGCRRSTRRHPALVDEMSVPTSYDRCCTRGLVLVTVPLHARDDVSSSVTRAPPRPHEAPPRSSHGRRPRRRLRGAGAKADVGELPRRAARRVGSRAAAARIPLWKTPNLVITPHVSYDDADSYIPRTLDTALRNVRRLARATGEDVVRRNRILEIPIRCPAFGLNRFDSSSWDAFAADIAASKARLGPPRSSRIRSWRRATRT